MRPNLNPSNTDQLNIPAGMAELESCGYLDPQTQTVIQYALMRWMRGEEEAAQRAALDTTFHGIELTVWYRVLAAAKAAEAVPPYFRRTVTITVQNSFRDQLEVCLRYGRQGRNWEVFINRGLLSDGRESAHFFRFDNAITFALEEAVKAEAS